MQMSSAIGLFSVFRDTDLVRDVFRGTHVSRHRPRPRCENALCDVGLS